MAEPLRIDVLVNAADLAKLSDMSQQVAASVNALVAQFTSGQVSSEELARQVKELGESFLGSVSGVNAQKAAFSELQVVTANLKGDVADSAKEFARAGGAAGVTAGFMNRYAAEQRAAAAMADVLKTSQAQAAEAIEAIPAATTGAVASFSAAGQAAMAFGTELVANNAKVQAASLEYVGLIRDLALLKAAFAETKEAMLETGVTTEQLQVLTAQYAAQQTQLQLLQKEAVAAEEEYKGSLETAYAAEMAAVEAKALKVAQAQASADATQMEAASNEGMVSSEVEVAVAENVAAEAARVQAAAQAQAAAASTAAVTSNAKLSAAAQQASAMMTKQGFSAKQAEQALISLGYSAKEAAAAMRELATPPPLEPAVQQISSMDRAMAMGGVRIAAYELGLGQLGYAFARVGAVSAALAPILAALFPLLAATAFIQIIESALKTMEEWRNKAVDMAETAAKFERAVLKSVEAVDKLQESLAGLVGPIAAAEVELANMDKAVVDLGPDVTLLNKMLNEQPTAWTKFEGAIASVWDTLSGPFTSASETSRESIELFTKGLAASTLTAEQLPAALKAVKDEIKRVTEAMNEYANSQLFGPEQGQLDTFKTQIAGLEGVAVIVQAKIDEKNLKALDKEETINLKLLSARTAAGEARISLEDAESKALLRMHSISEAEFLAQELKFEDARTNQQLAALDERLRFLHARELAQPTVDFSRQEEGLQAERSRILDAGTKRRLDDTVAANQQMIANDLLTADAEIESAEKVAIAYMKQEEAQLHLRAKFTLADTPAAIESAGTALIRQNTDEINRQIEALKARAAAILARPDVKDEAPKLTAPMGTMDFSEQLKSLKADAPRIYKEILDLNTQIMTLMSKGATDRANLEQDVANKTREYRREELNNTLTALNEGLITERDKYNMGSTDLASKLARDKIELQEYYDGIKKLAKKNREEQQALFDEERRALANARAAETITEQEYAHKILAIVKREKEAERLEDQRVETAAKKAIEKEEQDIKRVTDKIANDFVKMGHTLLTTHTSIGQAASKLGQDIEISLVEKGINVVTSKWAQKLVELLAHHFSFFAAILGIETTTAATQGTLHATEAAAQLAADKVKAASLAGLAGAGGVASMAAAPFPIDLTAPAFGAQMAAAAAGFGVFEKGGIVSVLHHGEMVLPRELSSFVQQSAASYAASSAAPNTNFSTSSRFDTSSYQDHRKVNVTVNNNGRDLRHEDIAKAVQVALRRGSLKV